MNAGRPGDRRGSVAILVKGYPRLSETFIAQELVGLQRLGLPFAIWSLRHPTDGALHPLHRAMTAPVHYLPEYLYQEPLRVLRGLVSALRRPALGPLMRVVWRDVLRDPTPNRGRRLGQALVLARELPDEVTHLHVHFLHTPGSVARYAALLTGRTFSFSAHAKDIWTLPDWEKREKIADATFGVTCSRDGLAELLRAADAADHNRVSLVYHGLDLSRFPPPPDRDGRSMDRLEIASVGRLVAKKGFDDLLDALARLPAGLDWHFTHIGGGELKQAMRDRAASLGIAERITWRGAQAQEAVVEALRQADLFALACKPGPQGDRDGLPNVILEAATQGLPIVSTRFAGVPEFVTDGETGLLVPPGDVAALTEAIVRLASDRSLRLRLGENAYQRVRDAFSAEAGLEHLMLKLDAARSHATPVPAAVTG